jgi:hypothetical protein
MLTTPISRNINARHLNGDLQTIEIYNYATSLKPECTGMFSCAEARNNQRF